MPMLQAPDSTLAPIAVTYHADVGEWELLREARYYDADRDIALIGRPGFRFDLASVPRAAWPLIAPFELSIAAPLWHDLFYRHGGRSGEWLWIEDGLRYSRAQADRLFLTHMRQEGVSWWRRKAAFRAVRWFGSGSWRG